MNNEKVLNPRKRSSKLVQKIIEWRMQKRNKNFEGELWTVHNRRETECDDDDGCDHDHN